MSRKKETESKEGVGNHFRKNELEKKVNLRQDRRSEDATHLVELIAKVDRVDVVCEQISEPRAFALHAAP